MCDRFTGIKFWSSERNTENTMSHLYYNEDSDYSEENACENEVFRFSIEKKLNICLNCRFITYSIRIGNLDWCKCQKQRLYGVMWKKVFFKISQNSQETPVLEKALVNFSKFLRTPLLQNNSGRLLLKFRYCNNEVRDIYRLYLL